MNLCCMNIQDNPEESIKNKVEFYLFIDYFSL